jgi:hypothetical protein
VAVGSLDARLEAAELVAAGVLSDEEYADSGS